MPRLWNETQIIEAVIEAEDRSASTVVRCLQGRIGYVPVIALELLAAALQVSFPALARAARATPGARHSPLQSKTLYVCDGIDCSLPRCREFAGQIVRTLGIDFYDRTDDGALRLKPLRCREIPTAASVVMVDDEICQIATPAELEDLLGSLMIRHHA